MATYKLLASGEIIIHKSGVPGHVFGTVIEGGTPNDVIEYTNVPVIRESESLPELRAERALSSASTACGLFRAPLPFQAYL